jgi:hypothetical protein
MPKELSPLGKAALKYASYGWAVFPLVPHEHRPLIKDYYSASSTDTAQIETWWGAYPQANIGLDCGKSGIVTIDVDPKNGGDKTFPGLKMLTGGGATWKTRRHRTPTDGEHYLFAAPPAGEDGLRTGSDRFGKGTGIDVKGRGGYIVLPPSKRTGYGKEVYHVVDDIALAPLPRALRFPPTAVRDVAGRTEFEARLQDGERIALGAQDNFLAAVAGRLRRTGFEDIEIAALLAQTYALRCEPAPKGVTPHTEVDFMRIARQAQKWQVVETLLEDAAIEQVQGEWDDADQTVSIPARTFIRDYTDATDWIVDGIFQATSLNQLTGGPKSGKSTLARRLAVDVAYGLPYLGRFQTRQGRVLYYSLQENKAHLRSWLAQQIREVALAGIDVQEDIPIDFVFRLGRRGGPAVKGLLARCKRRDYILVIIDMFGRFGGLKSLDDYAEVEGLCDALKDAADQTGVCILWLHHERKAQGPDPFVGTLGSQAIRGAVYTTARMVKDHGRYYLSTEQREGDDLTETAIVLDKDTGAMRASGSRLSHLLADEAQWRSRVTEYYQENPKATAKSVVEAVGGRTERVAEILRELRASRNGGAEHS